VNRATHLKHSFAGFGPADTASLIAAAADVALVVDSGGVIRDVSIGSQEFAGLAHNDWIGRPWAETVTSESRPKVEALLKGASGQVEPQWRHINQSSIEGTSVPILFSTIQAGPKGQVVAIGRDLRQFAAVQQRLVAAQQSMQRDYVRLRQTETRYRMLFESISEPVLIVDAGTLKIIEANPASGELFAESPKRMLGRLIGDCFDPSASNELLATIDGLKGARQSQSSPLIVRTANQRSVELTVSAFRVDNDSVLLINMALPSGATAAPNDVPRQSLLAAIERAPDGLVVTDTSGRVLYANHSFAEMAQFDTSEQLTGESLDRWLGRSGVDLGVLMANLRQNDAVRLFPTVIRGRFGAETSVEISAASVPNGKQSCLGFTIRDVGRRLQTESRGSDNPGLSRAVAQLAELVGRVPLKDIVGQTTDLIEQMCIEAALQLTRDNRAAAAEMLGLSRQSLYVKLRRYGLGEHPAENPN
jgi:transcriptional regulator PpsR